MFHYRQLEEILNMTMSIYKHGQCIYDHLKTCSYEYEIDAYRVCTSHSLTNVQLNLVALIIEKNEEKQPFWYRVLKDLPYTSQELPKNFEESNFIELWLIESSQISDFQEIIKAAMNSSEVLMIDKDMLLIILNDAESITPIEMIGHLESEAMIAAKIYIGPKVESLSDLKRAYEETCQLKAYAHHEHDQIIDYKHVLFSKVLYELSDTKRQDIIQVYHDIYPVHLLNEELTETIHGFFTHNLNITDTANALFLHRNTLVYRLNKIHTLTHLDIRQFDDATKMKILLSLTT